MAGCDMGSHPALVAGMILPLPIAFSFSDASEHTSALMLELHTARQPGFLEHATKLLGRGLIAVWALQGTPVAAQSRGLGAEAPATCRAPHARVTSTPLALADGTTLSI